MGDWERLRINAVALILGTVAIALVTSTTLLVKYKDEILSHIAPDGYTSTIGNLERQLAETKAELEQKVDNKQLDLYLDVNWGRTCFKSKPIKGFGSATYGPDTKIVADVHKSKGPEIISYTKDKQLKFYRADENLVKKVGEDNRYKVPEKNLITAFQLYDATGVSPVNIVGDDMRELMIVYYCNCKKQVRKFALYKFFENELREIWGVEYKADDRKWFERLRFLHSKTEGNQYDIRFDEWRYVYNPDEKQFMKQGDW